MLSLLMISNFWAWFAKIVVMILSGTIYVFAVFYSAERLMSAAMKAFWLGVFSDGSSPSFSRVATGFLLLISGYWITHLVIKNSTIPDVAGVVLLISTLYGINTLPKVVEKAKG